MSAIVLAGPDPAFEERVREAFGGRLDGDLTVWSEGLDGGAARETVDAVAALGPRLVALGPGLELDEWSRLAEAFDREHPEISVVVVAPPSPKLWELALRSGARDVISPEAARGELRAALERALDTAERRRANLLGEPAGGPLGHVVSVMGPKGGVGKTTVATNLAVGLAAARPREVVLVDLDLRFGDVPHALRVEGGRTLADALREGADEDPIALKTFLTPHATGLYVMLAPDSPAEADEMSAEAAGRLLRALGEAFPFVVVDTGSGLDDFTLAAADAATDLVLVAVTDVPSVRCMRKEVDALDRIGMTGQQRHFAVNRSDRQVGLGLGDIEEAVGLPVCVAVPSSMAVTLSVNQGSPLLAGEEMSPPAEALRQLVARFAEVPARRPAGPALLPWKKART